MPISRWYGLLINGHLKRIGRFDESPHIADFGVKARCAVQYEVREVKPESESMKKAKLSRGVLLYPPGSVVFDNPDGTSEKITCREIAVAAIEGQNPVAAPDIRDDNGDRMWGFIQIDGDNFVTNQDMVREFHETFDVPMAENPSLPSPEVAKLRMDLIAEEFRELQAGFARGDIVEIADALADLLYVTYGAGLVCGIDLNACFSEVHRSNQAKVGPNGEVRRREDGKILKPEGWTAPNLAAVLGVSL